MEPQVTVQLVAEQEPPRVYVQVSNWVTGDWPFTVHATRGFTCDAACFCAKAKNTSHSITGSRNTALEEQSENVEILLISGRLNAVNIF